ncbi:MAG: TRM11 family SAM-dependent methyltransferase [Candidatus Thorarchaeota archaeon]|jgi:tRNA G10  N-methylase Trm11
MTGYAFVLGKNWLLSLAELVVYVRDRGLADGVKDYSRTAAIVEIEETLDDEQLVEIQSALGGCFKTGRVVSAYDRSLAEGAFPAKGKVNKQDRKVFQEAPWTGRVWRKMRGGKVKFGVSTYPMLGKQTTIDLRRFTLGLDDWTKKRILELGARKAAYYVYEGPDKRDASRPNVALWPQSIGRHGLLTPPNAELLAMLMEDTLYIAKTIAVYDSTLQRYRDETRPFMSAEISTSPKICRTLLTLSGARPGDTVLDPFCGTGTLLMEAAMLDMKCIGIDIEQSMVKGAGQNLKWLGTGLGAWIDFKLIKGDARNASKLIGGQVDAVAFEPHLGPTYSERPTYDDASASIDELTQLYRDVLESLESCLRPGGRIAMTLPVVNTTEKQVSIDLAIMMEGTGFVVFKLLPKDAFAESAPKHRQLHVIPERSTLPERKRGQIVERNVVMLGKT